MLPARTPVTLIAATGLSCGAVIHALRHPAPSGGPLLPYQWTAALLGLVLLAAIAITGLAMLFVWRHPPGRPPPLPASPIRRMDRSPARAPAARRLAAWFVLAAVLATLALLMLRQPSATIRIYAPGSTEPTSPAPTGVPGPGEQMPDEQMPDAAAEPGLGLWYLLGTALLLALLVMGMGLSLRLPRGGLILEPTETEPAQAPPGSALRAATEQGLAAIGQHTDTPRAAIIACYAAMEQALRDSDDASPRESDTPREVIQRASRRGYLGEGPATVLVDLFTEARFSQHPMTREDQQSATAALSSMLADLRRTLSARSS
ncbi:DUF4129 domain-containing protein [Hoyosella sp. G463]|uniref:DUF4129 domain-containing protein n=2 Tax=Lolliginicoccus lacisalsi TaxID=2742202 RepID=A0A927JCI2_9ACTN|nr:DUF4129 domain-containing protein [Lolliginicoccus lacisalsi]